MIISLILPVAVIPDGSEVTKVTGDCPYVLHKSSMRIVGLGVIEPPEGGAFLLGPLRSPVCVSLDSLLKWTVPESQALAFLQERQEASGG
jgi:hypothetical protein